MRFLTFADKRLWKTVDRIRKQAYGMQVYDAIHCCDESSLDRGFWAKWGTFISSNPRGWGYWCWKPQIVLQTLWQMKDGDILHYCDAGCHLVPSERRRLLRWADICADVGILAFQQEFIEAHWTKGDLFDFFGERDNPNITGTAQLYGATFLIKKDEASVEFIREWLSVFDHVNLIDDSPSVSPNLDGFIEHRHDQSVFSILCKKRHVLALPALLKTEGVPVLALHDKEWS